MLFRGLIGAGGSARVEGWNISTATFAQSFSVSAQETTPTSVFFKPDGLKMYVLGFAGDDVNEYNLSTAWNISTATFLQVFSVSAQDVTPNAVSFKPDGTKMYVVGLSQHFRRSNHGSGSQCNV